MCSSSTAAASTKRKIAGLLTHHPYPARNVAQNIADLRAQIAANEKGVHEMRKMIAQFGLDVVDGLYGPRAGQRGGKRAAA